MASSTLARVSIKKDRTLPEIHEQLWDLHRQVGTLVSEVQKTPPTIGLAFFREPLRAHDIELERLSTWFMNVDADLVAHARHGEGISGATMKAAQVQVYFGARDSVRGALVLASEMLGSLRTQLDFRLSMAVATIALIVSGLSAFSDVRQWLAGIRLPN